MTNIISNVIISSSEYANLTTSNKEYIITIIFLIILVILGIVLEWGFHPLSKITKSSFEPSTKKNVKKMNEVELKKYVLQNI